MKTKMDRIYLGDPVRLEERNTMKTETPDNYITAHEIEAEPGSDESEHDSNFPSEEPETVADNATNETRMAPIYRTMDGKPRLVRWEPLKYLQLREGEYTR